MKAKWIIALIVELLLILILSFGIGRQYIASKYDRLKVDEMSDEALGINMDADPEMSKYTQIALFGLDTEDNDLGTGSRSDAIMILSINNSTGETKILSIYRDTLVQIEKDNPVTSKINSAYAYGGPAAALKTINSNFDLAVSEYAAVNWEGMTRAIDAVGGVQVHIEQDEVSELNKYLADQMSDNGIYSDGIFNTGYITLNGAQATAYSRIRSTDQGDITRTQRHREVMLALMDKLRSADPATLDKALDEILPYVKTSITEEEFVSLISSIKDYDITYAAGYPFRWELYDSPDKGACEVTADLIENNTALHRYLFGSSDYDPSDKVKSISDRIESETGISGKGAIEDASITDAQKVDY